MHEIALSTQLARAVSRAADGATVVSVRVAIGALRQVVPETLEYAWGFTVKGTALNDAKLDINWIPLRLRCCGEWEPDGDLDMHCPTCGNVGDIVAGREFTLLDIDIVRKNHGTLP